MLKNQVEFTHNKSIVLLTLVKAQSAEFIQGSVPGSTGTKYMVPECSMQIKTEPKINFRGPRGQGIQRGRGTYQNCGGPESERRIGNAITATSLASLRNTDNDAQQDPLLATSARKWAIT